MNFILKKKLKKYSIFFLKLIIFSFLLSIITISNIYYKKIIIIKITSIILTIILSTIITLNFIYKKNILKVFDDCRKEIKKIIWPSVQETIKITITIFIVTIIISMLIWFLDSISFKMISAITMFRG
ncbi:preprotein translocase subunit SecE [Buchnera aphidicola (Taiwanaphis decaspermi)]|uniref:preprotein translocase subunit SecE n=1 Tax=Buchnera aphidicola TaxID=9 RepID=UPI0031B85D6E